ncbi:lymphocyte antigen 6A-2/6E-1-like [Tubulanus polymorphus]|uniref:lymphocyte antigen 6A-2/6E-1-like n=1 Tax=Tubulanus polymorphus TaxID=672921 RepID=UPI003DA482B1
MRPRMTLFLLLGILSTCFQQGLGIYCYSCKNETTNARCSRSEDVIDCDYSKGRAKNVCITMFTFDKNGKKLINKECGSGPCSLSNKQNSALGLWCPVGSSCPRCCNEDRCNISVGNRLMAGSVSVFAGVILNCLRRHLMAL